MTKLRRRAVVIAVVVAVAAFFAYHALSGGSDAQHLTLDEYTAKLDAGKVATATIHDQDHRVSGTLANGTEYTVDFPDRYTEQITSDIVAAGVKEVKTDHQQSSPWLSLLIGILPFVAEYTGEV